MRILYGAGNRVGANSQLYRFLNNLDKKHTVSIAAYASSSYIYTHLNWTLDALHHEPAALKRKRIIDNIFGHKGGPRVNIENLKLLIKEIEDFAPDLIINDCELITANIAKSLKIKLWYCSPIHLLDGVAWDTDQLGYRTPIVMSRKILNMLPDPDRVLVYSPFGNIKYRPQLKSGYSWINPYHIKTSTGSQSIAIINDNNRFANLSKILNGSNLNINLFSPFKEEFANMNSYLISNEQKYINILSQSNTLFTTGETSYISDAFYSGHNICVAPSLKDAESLLNARMVQNYELGTDLHQVEYMEYYALDEIEKSINKIPRNNYINNNGIKFLHEEICI